MASLPKRSLWEAMDIPPNMQGLWKLAFIGHEKLLKRSREARSHYRLNGKSFMHNSAPFSLSLFACRNQLDILQRTPRPSFGESSEEDLLEHIKRTLNNAVRVLASALVRLEGSSPA